MNFSQVPVKGRQLQQACLLACKQLLVMWSHQHRHIVSSPQLKHLTGIQDEQKRTQHTSLLYA